MCRTWFQKGSTISKTCFPEMTQKGLETVRIASGSPGNLFLSTFLRPSRHRAVQRRPQRANDPTGDPKKFDLWPGFCKIGFKVTKKTN